MLQLWQMTISFQKHNHLTFGEFGITDSSAPKLRDILKVVRIQTKCYNSGKWQLAFKNIIIWHLVSSELQILLHLLLCERQINSGTKVSKMYVVTMPLFTNHQFTLQIWKVRLRSLRKVDKHLTAKANEKAKVSVMKENTKSAAECSLKVDYIKFQMIRK